MPPGAVRWIREQIWFLLVLAGMVVAFAYLLLTDGHWRRSTALMGVMMLVAAVLRLVVPQRRLGLLHVRGRWRDTAVYAVIGVLVLAIDIRLSS
ncbi:MAG: DUF3017 domain-containing protein [Jatrophihabitans sp.]|uniref:DUF3017 domain-containing protein n=1 Tax=Jatrophihabitans sp. TaxID=1932789 RepID=UPI003F7FD1FB